MDYVIVASHRPQRAQLSPNTPEQELIRAIRNGRSLDTLCGLLDQVTDVNAKGDGFWTPLTLASYLGLYNFVIRLLQLGAEEAKPETRDESVCLCCDQCKLGSPDQERDERNSSDTGNIFGPTNNQLSGCENPRGGNQLKSLTLEDADPEEDFCDEVADASTTGTLVHTCRRPAVKCAHHAAVGSPAPPRSPPGRVCLINECNDTGETALICAVRSCSLQVCGLLLDHGADVNLPSQSSRFTALHIAVENCSHDAVDLLLQHGADVQASDNVGITPLYVAIKTRSARMVRKLVEAGCDVNIGSQDHTPIFLAARLGLLDICQVLCEAGCRVNVQNKYGVTPVYEAALKGHTGVLSYLLNQGSSVNQVDMYNSTALHVAAMNGNVDSIRILVAAGGSLRMRDQQGRCPVHLAIQQGKTEAVRAFLQLGVDIVQPAPPYFPLVWWQSLLNNADCSVGRLVIAGSSALPLPSLLQLPTLVSYQPTTPQLMLLSGLRGAEALLQEMVEKSPESLQPETLHFITEFLARPGSLKALARIAVRRCLGNKIFHRVPLLPLPAALQGYLMMSDCED